MNARCFAIGPDAPRTVVAVLPAALLATRRAIRDDASRWDMSCDAMLAPTSTESPAGARQRVEYATAWPVSL